MGDGVPADFSARIRGLRTARRLSQPRLAAAIGVSTASVNRWEHGQARPSALAWRGLLSVEAGRSDVAGSNDKRSSNLPAAVSSFIGRERELEAVRVLLRREDIRLLTLTGAGGSGKTRLALEAARGLIDEFEAGVCFVGLASLAGPAFVASTIAQALSLPETPGRSPKESLIGFLEERCLLLLLDNCEHLLDAPPLVGELLVTCPRLKVLATSRAVLHISGEHSYVVPPLEVPKAEQLSSLAQVVDCAAVRLFIERARAAKAGFDITADNAQAVAAICRRLDGLPLAIELAAARANVLPPRALLQRLDHRLSILTGGAHNLPARQQTLRGTIAWGYDLLSGEEQQLFRGLAAFAGGCTLEAAEKVTGDRLQGTGEALTLLASLVDKSLLWQEEMADGEPRFRMLETIREYAWGQLKASGEAESVRQRHAAYYLALAEAAAAQFEEMASPDWLERVDHELDNLRMVLAWSTESPDRAEIGLRLVTGLHRYWDPRGYWAEGRAWFAEALEHGHGAPSPARAKALRYAGYLARLQEDYASARDHVERSLALSRQAGLGGDIAAGLRQLGRVALAEGDLATAYSLFEECLAVARRSGEWLHTALALSGLALVNNFQADIAAARPRFEESLALLQDHGLPFGTPLVRSGLASIAQAEGDFDRAEALFEQALAIGRRQGDRREVAQSLASLAGLAARRRDDAHAQALAEESVAIYRELRAPLDAGPALSLLALLKLRQGDHALALTLYQERLAIRYKPGEAQTLAASMLRLAALSPIQAVVAVEHAALASLLALAEAEALQDGAMCAARRWFGVAQALRRMARRPLGDELRSKLDRLAGTLRAALGEERFAEAVQAGLAASLEQTIGEAVIRIEKAASTLSPQSSALSPFGALTAREVEIIGSIAAGMSNTEIAAELVVSVRTVERHIGNIYGKLGVHGRSARAAVATYAARHDLLPVLQSALV